MSQQLVMPCLRTLFAILQHSYAVFRKRMGKAGIDDRLEEQEWDGQVVFKQLKGAAAIKAESMLMDPPS